MFFFVPQKKHLHADYVKKGFKFYFSHSLLQNKFAEQNSFTKAVTQDRY